MKRLFSLCCDAVFITRPIILIPVWAYFLLGFYRSSLLYHPESFTDLSLLGFQLKILTGLGSSAGILNLIMLTFSVAATYILNQLADLETDRKNGGLPLLAKAGVSRKLAAAETIVLAAVPCIYALFVRGPAMIFLFLVLLLNVLYNLRPFYFTGRPFLDFTANAAGFGLVAFGLGWVSAAGQSLPDVSRYLREAVPYVLLMVAGSINSTLPDAEGDARTGKRTTVVVLGTRRANAVSTAALLLALMASVLNRDYIAGITAALSLPFFILYLRTNNLKHGLHTFQTCGSFLMLLTVILFPWLFLWGAADYGLTRLYFKFRFNAVYPQPGV